MSASLLLGPVSAAVYAALNVPALTTLAPGGVSDAQVPQGAGFPRVWFTVSESNAGGMGSSAVVAKINLRIYAAAIRTATAGAPSELQDVLNAAKDLLEDVVLTFSSGVQAAGGIFYGETPEATPDLIEGVPCWTQASNYYLWAEA